MKLLKHLILLISLILVVSCSQLSFNRGGSYTPENFKFAYEDLPYSTALAGKVMFEHDSNPQTSPIQLHDRGFSPYSCGDNAVFFIRELDYRITAPMVYYIDSGVLEQLLPENTCTCAPYNYICPAQKEDGSYFVYVGAIDLVYNPLIGWNYLLVEAEPYWEAKWSEYGGYLCPAISRDGSMVGWCQGDFHWGERDIVLMETETYEKSIKTALLDVEEAYDLDLNQDGSHAVFCVYVYEPGTNLDTAYAYHWDTWTGSRKIDTGNYTFVNGAKIDGVYIVMYATPDPLSFRGWNILGSRLIKEMKTVSFPCAPAWELSSWEYNVQKIFCDVTSEGDIIYGRENQPYKAHIYQGDLGPYYPSSSGINVHYRTANYVSEKYNIYTGETFGLRKCGHPCPPWHPLRKKVTR